MKKLNLPKRILLAAALLGFSFDLFFYGKALGISLLLFVLLGFSALAYLGRSKAIRPKTTNLWLLLPLLFCAAMVALRANTFLIFLNVAAVLLLFELVIHFYTSGRIEQLGFFEFPVILTWVAAQSAVQAAPLVPNSVNLPQVGQTTHRNLKPVIRGLLLSAPILLVFTLFLASADQVFAAYIGSVLNPDIFDLVFKNIWRGLLIVVVTWVAAGGYSYSLLHQSVGRGSSAVQRLTAFARRGPSLGFTEAAIILGSVNALFLSFVAIQFTYLFGGQTNIRVDAFTYADYARRGFFELVAVALMTLGLVLLIHWLTTRNGRNQTRFFNALSSLMSALVMVMLVSAFQRLLLYEEAYGYTWLRLWVHTFMVWLGFVFVWFMITLWRSPAPSPNHISLRAGVPNYFAFGIFLAAIGFLTSLNLLNPDRLIARQNLARYAETGDLDLYYLTQLSDDALPVLIPRIGTFAGGSLGESPLPEEGLALFCDDLRRRQHRLNNAEDSWLSFNLGRYQARQSLNNLDWESFCPEPQNRG